MKRFVRTSLMTGLATLALVVGTMPAFSQPGGRGAKGGQQGGVQRGGQGVQQGGQRGGQPGGRGNFDPAQMQERMLEFMKEGLKVGDDEWTAIKPLLGKVMEAQSAGRGGRGGFGGRGRGGEEAADAPKTPRSELQAAVEDEGASAADLKAKLKAYRAERTKNEAALKKAREELRAVLTVRQEAFLVLRGMLD